MTKIFDKAERERLAAMDPAKATPEDAAALNDLVEVQLSELSSGIDRHLKVHTGLLAAAKVVLSAVHSQIIGHPYDLDSAINQLDSAVIAAEESAP